MFFVIILYTMFRYTYNHIVTHTELHLQNKTYVYIYIYIHTATNWYYIPLGNNPSTIKFHELAGSRRSSQKRKNVILSGVWNFHEANKGTKIEDAAAKRHCTTLFL